MGMDSRFLVGRTERVEVCSFCWESVRVGEAVIWHEQSGDLECGLCYLERVAIWLGVVLERKGSKMAWTKPAGEAAVGNGGPIRQWAVDLVLEGRLVATRLGKDFGKGPSELMVFNDEHQGEVTYPIPTILKDKLSRADKMCRLRIECLGKIPTKSGTMAWNFAVYEDR